MQKQATVRSSVLEVLLEITKYSDLYLMERVLDDESEVSNSLLYIQSSFIYWSYQIRCRYLSSLKMISLKTGEVDHNMDFFFLTGVKIMDNV